MRVSTAEEGDLRKKVKSVYSVGSDDPQTLAFQLIFADRKAISSDISDPDILEVTFTDLDWILDLETGAPLGEEFKTQSVKLGVQITQDELEKNIKMAENAAKLGLGLAIV